MHSRVLTGLAVVALSSALAACGGSGSAPTTIADGGATPAAGGPDGSDESSATAGASAAGQARQTSVRIGNFYVDQNLQPGPALDLYDTPVGQAATPILTAVAHGLFSGYVHPDETGGIVQMYVLPTGEDPVANKADGKGVGGYQDDGSNLQETLVLASEGKSGSGCFGTGPICELDVNTVVEKGDDANGSAGPVAPAPAAGQAELLVSAHVVEDENLSATTGGNVSYYFLVDASCDPPLNGDAKQEPGLPYVFAVAGSGSSDAIFATTPGTHQISVVANGDGTLPTCDALTPRQGQMSVDVTAAQQTLVYVYGTSVTDLHLAVASIQP